MEKVKIAAKAVIKFILKFKLELVIILGGIILDQVSKAIIVGSVGFYEQITLIPKFLHITYVENDGAAFSILRGQTWFFILFPTLAAIGFSIYLFYKKIDSKLFCTSLSLVVSGTVGNLLDRIFNQGKVVDFIEFEYFGKTIFGSTSFPIFNFADSCLVIGVIIFAIYFLFLHKSEEKKPPAVTIEDSISKAGKVDIAEKSEALKESVEEAETHEGGQ